MFSQKNILIRINEFENRVDVRKYEYKGIRIWPLIRTWIFWQLVNQDPVTGNNSVDIKSKRGNNIGFQLLNQFKTTFISFYKALFTFKKVKVAGIIDLLFISRYRDHNSKIDGEYFNKHIDAILDITDTDYNYIKLEHTQTGGNKRVSRYKNTTFINCEHYINVYKILKKFKRIFSKDKECVDLCVELLDVLSTHFSELDLNSKQLSWRIENLIAYHHFYKRILSIVQPKIIFVMCYYSPENMALISAGSSLNIKTVDIQHGIQGEYRFGYTFWNKKLLREGYELLPDYFWTWGKRFKDDLEKWMGTDGTHKPIVGGYPSFSSFYYNRFQYDMDNLFQIQKKLEKYDRKILFTFQPFDKSIFPDIFLYALENSPNTWKWLVRFHPTLQTENEKELIISTISKTGADVDLDFSNKLFLLNVLNLVDFHVTVWSSTCHEALALGVHSIIIDPLGKEMFSEYVNEKQFSYVESGKDLIQLIKRGRDKSYIEQESPHIDTSKETVIQAIETIING